MASKLVQLLPSSALLPGIAKKQGFRQGLTDLSQWRPSDLPKGVSARGDPIRRWMIRKITEEFLYVFREIPSIGVVGDLIRLGWPETPDRSIRHTLDEGFLDEVIKAVETKRKNENQATATTSLAIARVSSNASREARISARVEAATQKGDAALLIEIERLVATLKDDYSRNRLLASIKATRDEAGYPQDNQGEPDVGN